MSEIARKLVLVSLVITSIRLIILLFVDSHHAYILLAMLITTVSWICYYMGFVRNHFGFIVLGLIVSFGVLLPFIGYLLYIINYMKHIDGKNKRSILEEFDS